MRQEAGGTADSDLRRNGADIAKKKRREVMAAARRVAPAAEKPLQNGDLYIGSFSGSVPHGIGKYLWSDGCTYEGEWRRGEASGHGKFSWPSGATYEGQFRSGRMDGFGVFSGCDGEIYRGHWSADRKLGFGKKSFANGDSYEGIWKRNLQEGRGKYAWKNGDQYLGEWRGGGISGGGFLKGEHLPNPNSSQVFFSSASIERRFSLEKNLPRICIWESDDEAGEITCDIVDALEASILYKDASFGEKIGVESEMKPPAQAARVEAKKPGQTISKGHKNYDLMLNLQLGIRYSVGKLSSSIKLRELRSGDFDPREKFWTRFPPEGSKLTPPHQTAEFKWKDYCPMVFRHLRNLFSVDPADYMLAICGDDALRELSSPGKSGSFFYLTQDDRFMIKTVKKSEVKVLIRMLRSYYQHVNRFQNSLVTKFYGVHCVKSIGGQKVRFIVIGNLFCSEHRIHRRFDLKGSSYGRITDKTLGEIDETTTLKDLDLNFVFRLKRSLLQELLEQIDRDCKFLEAEGIMDYSLLVGIHFRGENPSDPRSRTSDRRQPIRLGWSMAGKAVDQTSGEIRESALYFGIIDVLQGYDIGKKLEHAYKSLQVDPQSISAVDPKLYSRRFRRFLRRTFVEDVHH